MFCPTAKPLNCSITNIITDHILIMAHIIYVWCNKFGILVTFCMFLCEIIIDISCALIHVNIIYFTIPSRLIYGSALDIYAIDILEKSMKNSKETPKNVSSPDTWLSFFLLKNLKNCKRNCSKQCVLTYDKTNRFIMSHVSSEYTVVVTKYSFVNVQ